MQSSTPAYDEAIVADAREILFKAEARLTDTNAEITSATASEEMNYSNLSQTYDGEIKQPEKYITYEYNRVLLNGEYKVYPSEPDINANYCYVSHTLSDENCNFQTFPVLKFQITGVRILRALTIILSDSPTDGVIRDMSIEIKSNTSEGKAIDCAGNVENRIFVYDLNVESPTEIVLTIRAMSLPWRRARIAEIALGDVEKWNGDSIASLSLVQRGDISNVTLPYSTCEMVIDNKDRRFDPRNKYGLFESLESKQGIDISLGIRLPNNSVEYHKLGTYYQYADGWKTSENGLTIKWSLVDIFGLLSQKQYNVSPEEIPTTFKDWAASIVSQLGQKFQNKYIVPKNKEQELLPVIYPEFLGKRTCGDMLRNLAIATGTWLHIDAETGNIIFGELKEKGKKITLDNMVNYPVIMPNQNYSDFVFTLYSMVDSKVVKTKCVVQGYEKSSSKTANIDNPFIQTPSAAETAAKYMLATFGGNKIEIIGRGDMCSEIGDLDSIWLDRSNAISARRIEQEFSLTDGVLKNEKSVFVVPDVVLEYKESITFLESGTWSVPSDVTQIKLILIGKGQDGGHGTPGSYEKLGEKGTDGVGGKVWVGIVNVSGIASIKITFESKDVRTDLGQNSADGIIYPLGYAGIPGQVYARTGVESPEYGSGDGGVGGVGGELGLKREIKNEDGTITEIIDSVPGEGNPGVIGASGRAIIMWN